MVDELSCPETRYGVCDDGHACRRMSKVRHRYNLWLLFPNGKKQDGKGFLPKARIF